MEVTGNNVSSEANHPGTITVRYLPIYSVFSYQQFHSIGKIFCLQIMRLKTHK